jgi:hypothetical protein
MSHPKWFLDDPKAAWGFYAHRAELYRAAIPHEVNYMLHCFLFLYAFSLQFVQCIFSQF